MFSLSESGKYIPEKFNKKKVYKLVKKDKSVNLNDENLNLIKDALNKWETEDNAKFQFPEITNNSVVYYESEIGKFNLFDIYGIPFTYKVSGKTIEDTLLGNFKLERAFSFQTSKNIKELKQKNEEKEKFEIHYRTSEY